MEHGSLNFGFKARYYQLGTLGPATKNLIFVLHGHGQLAPFFIRKFSALDNGKNCIIAPEGLSRYYLQGFSGKVGATWMTKEDRLTDIENYLSYLNALQEQLKPKLSENTTITVLGFSQGAATASRWVTSGGMPFDRLVLWAGIFPPDMDFPQASETLRQKDITYVYGTEDPFLSPSKLQEMQTLSSKLGVSPKTITFKGVHEIKEDTLLRLFVP